MDKIVVIVWHFKDVPIWECDLLELFRQSRFANRRSVTDIYVLLFSIEYIEFWLQLQKTTIFNNLHFGTQEKSDTTEPHVTSRKIVGYLNSLLL